VAIEREKDISRLFREGKPIDDAMNAAVRQVVLLHEQLGLPLAVWRDGKVVWISPEEASAGDAPPQVPGNSGET
jgi:hypothetical protein